MKKSVITMAAALALVAGAVHAGEVKPADGGGTTWQAGVDGVEIEWAPDGSLKRISSTWRHPVNIPDRPGVSKAQIIAEEKAKAAIIRYMNQMLSSDHVVSEINHDLATSTARTEDDKIAMSTEVNRKMSESLTETTRSFASGHLRGVIILEKGFDPKSGEAWVTVGMSQRTMAAAGQLANAINTASGDTTRGAASGKATTESGGLQAQGGEVRRTNQKDW